VADSHSVDVPIPVPVPVPVVPPEPDADFAPSGKPADNNPGIREEHRIADKFIAILKRDGKIKYTDLKIPKKARFTDSMNFSVTD
jgi:hypothetical protein